MSLKWLLHCVQCHLVLLILVGFAVAGYLLRDELGTLVGWPGASQQPSPVAAPERQGARSQLAAPLPSAPGPAVSDPGLRSDVPPQSSAAASVSDQDMVVAGEGTLDPSPSVTQGEFRFRPMDDSMSTDSPDVDAGRRGEMLAVARRAYWNHDIALALKHYQALTQAYPNDPDFYGEMGNIYYGQGDYERAGQAYYEAGLLLLRRGQQTRARDLVDLLQKTAPAQAEDLLQQLQGTR